MTQDLFSKNDSNPQSDPNKDYLAELVGDNQKFKTTQDLARGKYESDVYIEVLKGQLDEMREDYKKLNNDSQARARLEDLVNQLQEKQAASSDFNPNANDEKQPPINMEELEKRAAQRALSQIDERDATKKAQDNFKIVHEKLTEMFGSNYQNTVDKQRESLGLSKEDINDLAKKSPTAFFRTLGLEPAKQEGFQAPPRSNQRSDNFAPRTEKRTWSYYQNLKKQNPNLYRDQKTNVQMQKDILELGEAFKDGDYNSR